ncbi:hypothetical protein IAD21_06457 (plasmid) [Abditibacteriota bacterium]|nr:hypothetical protein IAD21_06457 [Abditibacteriota bacterium]
MPALDLSTPDLSPAGFWDNHPDATLELSFSTLAHPLPDFLQLGLGQMDSLGGDHHAPTLERFSPAWSELLHRAVEEPGLICDAYTRFHGYSLGNRFAALVQCQLRGLEPGPLNSFGGWRKLGYAVKEGEKALTLCMPLKGTLHRERADGSSSNSQNSDDHGPDVEEVQYIRAFVWKPSWFVLSQTVSFNENTPALPVPAPLTWDRHKAFATLGIAPVAVSAIAPRILPFLTKAQNELRPSA